MTAFAFKGNFVFSVRIPFYISKIDHFHDFVI